MDDEIESAIIPDKGIWNKTREIVSSPVSAISKMTKESPAMVLIAILLVVQPVVQTGIDLVRSFIEFKQDLDPNTRPVTKAELDVINSKIDFLEKLVLADTADDRKLLNSQLKRSTAKSVDYDSLKKKLDDVEKKADEDYKEHKPKK